MYYMWMLKSPFQVDLRLLQLRAGGRRAHHHGRGARPQEAGLGGAGLPVVTTSNTSEVDTGCLNTQRKRLMSQADPCSRLLPV